MTGGAIAMYSTLLAIHLFTVLITITLFVVRGAWMLVGSPRLRDRWVRIVPHAVDTLLLASGIALAWRLGWGPLVHGWLTAKLVALVAYILLGTVALKRGRTPRMRLAAFVAALVVFGYIVSVARMHDPWGLLALAGL